MRKLYVTTDRVLLYLLKSRLEKQHIACLIKNEEIAGQAAGELPPIMVKPELWVMADEDWDTAAAILQDELSHQAAPKQPWVCSQCEEMLEGQFDLCWRCGKEKD